MTFDDGTQVQVGTLNNDGTGYAVTVPGGTSSTTMLFTINSVSSSTYNIGLSEVVVLGDGSGLPWVSWTADHCEFLLPIWSILQAADQYELLPVASVSDGVCLCFCLALVCARASVSLLVRPGYARHRLGQLFRAGSRTPGGDRWQHQRRESSVRS